MGMASRPYALPRLAGLLALCCVLALAIGCSAARGPGTTLAPLADAGTEPSTHAALPSQQPLVLDGESPVTVDAQWWGWTLLDRRTGQTWGSANETEVNRSASMTKAWLAAWYLRQHPDPSPSWLHTLSIMIRDSNNEAADDVHLALGGDRAFTDAMAQLCHLFVQLTGSGKQSTPGRGWAWTQISPHQAALLGDCIASGRVAEPRWTQWVLDEMLHVRGDGDFGIRLAFPQAQQAGIAIKNGWSTEGQLWVVNCLAVSGDWVLAVESRTHSFDEGSGVCQSVTAQLLTPPPGGWRS